MQQSEEGRGKPVMSRIGYVLKKVQAALRAAMDEQLRPLGIATPQYSVLSILDEVPGLSGAEVARRCFVTPQTMNELIVHLEQRGYLIRHRDKGARIIHLTLTPMGVNLTRQAHRQVGQVESRMLQYVSPTEQRHLLELLLQCAQGLGADNR
jgi:DNA-binding MarR family transcriptional regulator